MHRVSVGDKIVILQDEANAADVKCGDILKVSELISRDISPCEGEFVALTAGGEDWHFYNGSFDDGEISRYVDYPFTLPVNASLDDGPFNKETLLQLIKDNAAEIRTILKE